MPERRISARGRQTRAATDGARHTAGDRPAAGVSCGQPHRGQGAARMMGALHAAGAPIVLRAFILVYRVTTVIIAWPTPLLAPAANGHRRRYHRCPPKEKS
ncbi:hypothetical protein DBV23_02570 [Edwardsiella ictaluri]|nr:hypothetical protein DBV23_02570 [Edwardsiella ictaluri]STP87983.1 Uncharacterised protein [Edwardsiella ictaluri]BEH98319.1 hypothetical protein KH20906_10470 [Edwardsiella ictaluri]BEI01818.1 hypothetical protein KB20921_10790 [Edwardsiella ictaluri]BEI05286.1 hypothetical protein KH201010_10720 [Edwardsiella ictaluri]